MTATARGEGGPGLRVGRLPLRARGGDAVVEVQHHRCAASTVSLFRPAQTAQAGLCIPVGTRLQARTVLRSGQPKRCELACAFLWEHGYKTLKMDQRLSGPIWRLSHLSGRP